MFTGLIQTIGEVREMREQERTARLSIAAELGADVTPGESVAVDGVCLTVETSLEGGGFSAFASRETLSRTTLAEAGPGRKVNLERALRLQDRLGGHLVSGHVDALGVFLSMEAVGEGYMLWVEAPSEVLRVCVPKGSISIDGVSLTLVDVTDSAVSVAVIPETWKRTTLGLRKKGDRVNLESDLIGKYVARHMAQWQGGGSEAPVSPGGVFGLLMDRQHKGRGE